VIPINLLPHRAERRKAMQQQFAILAVLTLVIGGIVWFLGHSVLERRISVQDQRNTYLESRISEVNKKISEIKKLKQQTQALLSRKRVVETLQSSRTESVRLLDQLVRQLPEGIHLKTVKQKGQAVSVVGFATSNARVSTLMRNLEASPWLEEPKLIEIKAAKVDKNTLNKFKLSVKLTRPKEVETGNRKSKAKSKT
jgi:type IV pilus assembly protein PilN